MFCRLTYINLMGQVDLSRIYTAKSHRHILGSKNQPPRICFSEVLSRAISKPLIFASVNAHRNLTCRRSSIDRAYRACVQYPFTLQSYFSNKSSGISERKLMICDSKKIFRTGESNPGLRGACFPPSGMKARYASRYTSAEMTWYQRRQSGC